jgi:hypothetical protein
MNSTLWVKEYKGLYIHGGVDGNKCDVVWANGTLVLPQHKFTSYRSAQLFITKILGL